MNLLVFFIIGGIVGWLTSIIMRVHTKPVQVLFNIVIGIMGAFIGAWILSPMVGAGSINQEGIRIGAVIVSLVGAIVLVGIMHLFRRGGVRW